MITLVAILFGIMIAVKAMDAMKAHEGSGKAVESATDKAVGFIDKLFK
jgi:hypothetical protein